MRLGISLGLGTHQAGSSAGGGGSAFTGFSDDFSGTLAKWTQVGTSAIASGVWRVSATSAAIYADYEMPVTEGAWDLDVTPAWSGTFEFQVAVFADATLATEADPYRASAGKGYVIRVTSGEISLFPIDGTAGSALKTYTGTMNSGEALTIRITIASNGDRTFEVLVNGSTKGTHTIASASLISGIGTIFGVAGFAGAGATTDADDVSFDEYTA